MPVFLALVDGTPATQSDLARWAAVETNTLALSGLGPAERTVFLDLLKRLIATLEADRG